MKGFIDYLIASDESVCRELLTEAERKDEQALRSFISECRDIARDDEISTPVMFWLLKDCNMELETFDFAAELDELATGVRINIDQTALCVLISGLEKGYPDGVGIYHISAYTNCSIQKVLEYKNSFWSLCSSGILCNIGTDGTFLKSRFVTVRN